MIETPTLPDKSSKGGADSLEVQQFEEMIADAQRKGENRPEVYVSYDTNDPDELEKVQVVGEFFSKKEARDEFLKIKKPNAAFLCNVTKVYKWQDEEGKTRINISHNPEGIDALHQFGFQISDESPWYSTFEDLPENFNGQIIITNDKDGCIASVSLVEDKSESDDN